MGSGLRCKIFCGRDYLPTAVEAYIENVEEIATLAKERLGRRQEEEKKICCLLFRRNIRGIAQEWYGQLEEEVKMDWRQLKRAFFMQFAIPALNHEHLCQLLDRIQNLQQDNRTMQAYIDEVEQIGYFLDSPMMRRYLADRFIDGISWFIDRQIAKDRLRYHAYTLEEAIATVEDITSDFIIIPRPSLQAYQQETQHEEKDRKYRRRKATSARWCNQSSKRTVQNSRNLLSIAKKLDGSMS
jgi:Retrotransposon gag protein.